MFQDDLKKIKALKNGKGILDTGTLQDFVYSLLQLKPFTQYDVPEEVTLKNVAFKSNFVVEKAKVLEIREEVKLREGEERSLEDIMDNLDEHSLFTDEQDNYK